MDGPLEQQVQVLWHEALSFLGNTVQVKSNWTIQEVLFHYQRPQNLNPLSLQRVEKKKKTKQKTHKTKYILRSFNIYIFKL